MIYETQSDRDREARAARALEAAWQCSMRPTDTTAPVDYIAERDGVAVGVVEVKTQRRPFGRWRHVWIDAAKVRSLEQEAERLRCRGVIVWRFDDAIGFVRVDQLEGLSPETPPARSDRADPYDVDPAYRVPLERVRRLR